MWRGASASSRSLRGEGTAPTMTCTKIPTRTAGGASQFQSMKRLARPIPTDRRDSGFIRFLGKSARELRAGTCFGFLLIAATVSRGGEAEVAGTYRDAALSVEL